MKLILRCAAVASVVFGVAVAPAAADPGDDAVRLSRRAEGLARRAAFHLDEARVERDVRRARCHDSVLSQTHAVLRMVRYSLDREDDGRADRLPSLLSVLGRRLDELAAELRICNGEEVGAVSHTRTEVIVIVERWVPREDPTVLAARRSPFER